jgi:hypothetical protein
VATCKNSQSLKSCPERIEFVITNSRIVVSSPSVMMAVTIEVPRSRFAIRFPLVVPAVKCGLWNNGLFPEMRHCFFALGQSREGILKEGFGLGLPSRIVVLRSANLGKGRPRRHRTGRVWKIPNGVYTGDRRTLKSAEFTRLSLVARGGTCDQKCQLFRWKRRIKSNYHSFADLRTSRIRVFAS